ncbi:Outer membrane protein beta-barrel domain-containing protein [Parapedobacter luteus]|uniref:Outer membrane protein beta-barrel domain-containing protein n=1 Tax=Parapedobacter luteus TaxID=623280 RepID=A0A1T5A4M4_9SPHI|nr:porin family protein [Parapedobacter luteus]SKB29573.1 Outer membrane protein beta-barrel domain-containing protein [Parapedobacter luteus]
MQKKTIRIPLLILLFALILRPGIAQDYYSSTYQYKPISLGITFSPNMGWMRYGDNDAFESSPKIGYAYGLLADFAFTENYYFSTGLLINTMNSEITFPDPVSSAPNTSLRTTYRLQYAEIPLSLKLKSTMRYFRSYYGQFGFTSGFRLNAKEKLAEADNRTKLDGAKFFRLALQIGGGVEWQLDHNLVMMTGLSFNNGFTTAVNHGDGRNSYVAFNFGILF